jgi:hypothetical protein
VEEGVSWWLMGGIFAAMLVGVLMLRTSLGRRKNGNGRAKRP